MSSNVTVFPAASSDTALAHFEARLGFETDCWDVHDALSRQVQDFVLLDVRSIEMYEIAHLPGALHFPHGKIIASKMRQWSEDTLFVVYCAGPHCNGANKAAVRLAGLGRPVKEMIGGITGWADEGFAFATGSEPGSVAEIEAG